MVSQLRRFAVGVILLSLMVSDNTEGSGTISAASNLESMATEVPLTGKDRDATSDGGLATSLIEKTFSVTVPNTVVTITATPDDHIGFRLGLKQADSDDSAQSLIYDRRHYGRSVEPLTLEHLSLPVGKYTVVVQRDDVVNVDLMINTLLPPESHVTRKGEVKSPTPIGNDVLGNADSQSYFIKPNQLSPEKVYSAVLTYPSASATLYIFDEKGQKVNSRGGESPLTVTGLRGDKWALSVNYKFGENRNEKVRWRLTILEVDDALSFDEARSEESITTEPDGIDTSEFRGWIDPSDTDRIVFESPDPLSESAYYVHYKGPKAKLRFKVGAAESSREGHSMSLGPFAGNRSLALSIASKRPYFGAYTLNVESIKSDRLIALEPEGPDSEVYAASDKIHGAFSHSGDIDYISFDLGPVAQMWRPIVLGETVNRVELRSPYETLYQTRRDVRKKDRRRFPIPDLYMGPGRVTVQVSGLSGDYLLFMKPLGLPLPSSEREPNQSPFFRRVVFEQDYRGTLTESDTDNFSFFLEKAARLKVDLSVPAGALYQMDHQVHGQTNEKSPHYRAHLNGVSSYEIEGLAGENVVSLTPRVSSPAEYQIKFSFIPSLGENIDLSNVNVNGNHLVKAFSRMGQKLSLKSLGLASVGRKDIWTPSTNITLGPQKAQLVLAPDLPDGVYPVWVSSADGSPVVRVNIEANLKAVDKNPFPVESVPESMRGGINVALAALGAKWLSQDLYTFDPDGKLPRHNPANASNVSALNDGVSSLTTDRGYYHVLSNNADKIYNPTLKLAGTQATPIVGVVITNRVELLNEASRFAVDVSVDNINWVEVLNETLQSWDKRNVFVFPDGAVDAAYVRLRPLRSDVSAAKSRNELIGLTEFEVIAKPGEAGLGRIMISDANLGASGRIVEGKGYPRSINIGLIHTLGKPLIKPVMEGGYTDSGLTLSFKNQSIAEIDEIEFSFAKPDTPQADSASPPLAQYAIIKGSVSGPAGPFQQTVEIQIPSELDENHSVRVSLPERIRAKAVRIEYRSEDASAKRVQVPTFYRLYERAESAEYSSVLGLGTEYTARPYSGLSSDQEGAIIYMESANSLSTDLRRHIGEVELKRQTNRWEVKPKGTENTLVLVAKGEKGFSPNIIATTLAGKTVDPFKVVESVIGKGTVYHFDLPVSGLNIMVSEESRSTVFLMDQSSSAQAYIARARRSVMDYADMMVDGEDRVHFGALGRDWLSDDWISDSVVLRKKLMEYPTGGNSNGEGSIIAAAQRLQSIEGTRSIVILTDGDGGVSKGVFTELKASNARVFPIKLSSARIWGNPVQAMTTVIQWSEVTGGEMSYVFNHQDITDAYARISSRLLGPKSYELRAESKTRLVKPGTIAVIANTGGSAQKSMSDSSTHHILFDASGSMLKRIGNTRRIEIARKAVLNFAKNAITDQQKIGLRVFGGAPDTCETSLIVDPETGTKAQFIEAVSGISPQNKAKTPIAAALSNLTNDLAGISGSTRVLLLTDGEETCDGDAGAIIDELIKTELAGRVDIVSFSLDLDADRSVFKRWAERGRGLYIDAQDGASLTKALEQITHARYDVLNNGQIVASSKVGGQVVSVPKGDYIIRVNGKMYPASVESGQETQVILGE